MNFLKGLSKEKMLVATLFTLFFGVELFATGTGSLDALNQAGQEAKDVTIGAMQNWIWLVGFVPFGIATFVTWKVKEYLEQKDEQSGGQTEPKTSRYMKLIASFVAAVIIVYILLGIFAGVFAGKSFAESWQFFVVDFWSQLFN